MSDLVDSWTTRWCTRSKSKGMSSRCQFNVIRPHFNAAIRTISQWESPHLGRTSASFHVEWRSLFAVRCVRPRRELFSKPLQSCCPERRTVRRGCPEGLKWAEVKCILVSSRYVCCLFFFRLVLFPVST